MNSVYKLHARLFKGGLQDHPPSLHRLLLSCAASAPDSLFYMRSLFAHILLPDTLAYNTIIRAHSQYSPLHSLTYFATMRHDGVSPDHFTFPFVLKACSRLQIRRIELHSLIIKMGFYFDVYVMNSLISFYGCMGCVDSALKIFDEMTVKDLVSWSSLISCYSNNGLFYEALHLFQKLQLTENVKPDEVTMLSVVSAVSGLGALELGKWVEAFITKTGIKRTVSLRSALIDMYSRCGSVDDSIRVFDQMPDRSVLTWTSLINCLAVHGRGKEALRMFYEMKKSGFAPDHITIRGVLVGCSHSGLIDEGWQVFNNIKYEHGIEPTLEHYGCMVDLLGRAGLIDQAYDFVEKMPIKPNAVIWRTLLGACVSHKSINLAEKVKEKISELDPTHDGDFVLLSNAYGGLGKWVEKADVRASMRGKRIKKEPGYSFLNVDDVIHEFVSGDVFFAKSDEIKDFLVSVIDGLRVDGYIPYTSNVLHDIEEEEKEHSLGYHSEKLAVAFALFSFKDRRTIRIMKNLRICYDCHCFMKHVSAKFDKEIFIRDRNRFHHFHEGSCSCNDYW